MVNQDASLIPGLIDTVTKSLKKSNRGPKKTVWVEQDDYRFIEFEPFSYVRENFHLCVRTGMMAYMWKVESYIRPP